MNAQEYLDAKHKAALIRAWRNTRWQTWAGVILSPIVILIEAITAVNLDPSQNVLLILLCMGMAAAVFFFVACYAMLEDVNEGLKKTLEAE